MALTFGFTRSICFRCAASASRADSFFARISRAISTVLIKQTEEFSLRGQSALQEGSARHSQQNFAAGGSVVAHGCESIIANPTSSLPGL